MKKPLLFAAFLLVIFLALFSFIPKLVLADGMAIKHSPFSDRWDYSNENNQQAFINYDNGLQKMIISIGLEESTSSAVWLFPVPANPNKVVLDVVKILPQLSGEEITKGARDNLDDTKVFLQATQIYTIPFFMFPQATRGMLAAPYQMDYSFGASGKSTDVIVYEHLEKEGIASEIITAKTANGLYDYLKSKGLKIESGAIPVLDSYIGKDYSFIASWITQPSQASNNQRGVFVTFQTTDIYFPLLPTSVYGSKTVPATIRIIGHVSPKVFQSIKSYTKTEYFIGNYLLSTAELKSFYNGQTKDIKYTKIEIAAPSKFLTDDLWISNKAPVKIYFSTFVAQHPKTSAIILLILASIITGILAGLIIFKDLRKNPLKLALMGLFNCLTILGLVVSLTLFDTKNKNESIEPLLSQIKRKGYFGKRKVAAILLFVPVFFLLFGIFSLPSMVGEMARKISYSSRISSFTFVGDFLIPILIIYVLPITSLIIGFVIKKVKKEDKDLFKQLKSAGYSSWSFHMKDRMKIAFVPIFSILFLAISWLLVKLVAFTV